MCVCTRIHHYDYITEYFCGFNVYIFVDLVKHGVLNLVNEIQHYRNYSYYSYYHPMHSLVMKRESHQEKKTSH